MLVCAAPCAYAASCSSDGVTAVYVNGILTTEDAAKSDKAALEQAFRERTGRSDVRFVAGYNPTHLAGAGDVLKSIEQSYVGGVDEPIEDYDLQTILQQIHREVTTRQVLLVGYSQGSFYTNALYDYLTVHGVPAYAISVYNIATPASFVAGRVASDGGYLTSRNDGAINEVRKLVVLGGGHQPLPANIMLALEPGESTQAFAGHSLTYDYLAHAPSRIANDLLRTLSFVSAPTAAALSAKGITDRASDADGCFAAPPLGLPYQAEQAAFAVADPAASSTIVVGRAAYSVGASGLSIVGSLAASVVNTAYAMGASAVAAVGDALVSVPPAARTAGVTPLVDAGSVGALAVASGDALVPPMTSVFAATSKDLPERPAVAADVPPALSVSLATETPPTPKAPPEPLLQQLLRVATTTIESLLHPASGSTTPPASNISGGGGGAPPSGNPPPAPDTTPPAAPVISIAECAYSLSASSSDPCLLGALGVTVQWGSDADVDHYRVWVDGAFATSTTASTAGTLLADAHTSSVAVVAYDAAGNAATSTAVSVEVQTRPVVINEISWAGDDANTGDEWIELKNRLPQQINLSRLTLVSADGAMYVPLTGTLGVHFGINRTEYFVAYRSREPATPVYAGQTLAVSFPALSGTVRQLQIVQGLGLLGTTTLDATPAVGACGGSWCAGALASTTGVKSGGAPAVHSMSMERVNAATDGTAAGNWATEDRYSFADVHDGNGSLVFATPLADNSAHLPDAGWSCGADAPITAGAAYHPSSTSCRYLSAFIDNDGSARMAVLYSGTVGSSTMLNSHYVLNASSNQTDVFPPGVQAGDPFFVALYLYTNNPDATDFDTYFTTNATSTPNAFYRTIPFTWAP